MKTVFILMSLVVSQAFANPFDAFVGQYKLDGKIEIKNFNAKNCIRYGIPSLIGIEVKQDTKGYSQSHMIYLLNPAGWSGLPVMQFEEKSDFDPSIIYFARVSGGSNSATNVWGSNSREHFEDKVSLQRNGDKIIFNFSEEYVENAKVVAGCYYQATLK